MNIKIYKSRYDESLGSSSNESSYIKGYAIRERTHEMITDHFHILIAEADYLPDYYRMLALCEKQINRMANNFNSSKKIENFKLQRAYVGEDGYKLEHYVLKQFNEFTHHDVCSANFGILCNGGANFDDLGIDRGYSDGNYKGYFNPKEQNKSYIS